MFLDGVTYAAIARNLAAGRGRFWEPFYTATIYPAFHEHPPLGFWLESLYFRSLGDHWWSERIYCATAGVLTALAITWIWRGVYRIDHNTIEPGGPSTLNDAAREFEWLPVLLWIVVPVVSWTIVGNLLETTVALFVTAAVTSLVAPGPARLKPDTTTPFLAGTISGLCIVAAVLSKGPVGLFPMAAPLILGMLPERRRQVLWLTAGQWATVAACALVLLAVPASRESLRAYGSQQVVATLVGRRGTAGSSLTTLMALAQVWLQMIIVLGALTLAAGRWRAPGPREQRVAVAFILLGLAGTLPIMISPRQTGHYIMPAVAFYALGVAALALATTREVLRRLARVRARAMVTVAAAAILVLAVVAARLPALERDPARLADLDRIAAVAPRGATVGICGNMNGNWVLHAWMQRRFEISLDATPAAAGRNWFLKTAADDRECATPRCAPVSQAGGGLVLLRCR